MFSGYVAFFFSPLNVVFLFRFETCYQIALAIKDEVEDLEKAGITVIQIDEAALREGLPLRKSEQAFYLDWAVHSFRITNSGVQDTTQVQSYLSSLTVCVYNTLEVVWFVSCFRSFASYITRFWKILRTTKEFEFTMRKS